MNIDELRNNIKMYEAGPTIDDTAAKKEIIAQLQDLYNIHAEMLKELEKQLFENRRLRGVLLNRVDK